MAAVFVVAAVFMLSSQVGVAVAVAHLIAMEMLDAAALSAIPVFVSATGVVASPSIVAVVVIIDMPPEAPGAAIPGASTDEDAAREPFGPVVTIGRAVIGRVIEITIRTHRRWSNLHRNLGFCLWRRNR